MEEILKDLKEKHRKVSEFINKNYDILNKEEVQSKSEIDLFNKIGDYAIDKNYHPVYFKSKKPSNYNEENIRMVDVHYIHIYNDNGLKASIYYDGEGSMLSHMGQPYYELYDLSDVKRFLKNEEDELTLFNEVKLLFIKIKEKEFLKKRSANLDELHKKWR